MRDVKETIATGCEQTNETRVMEETVKGIKQEI